MFTQPTKKVINASLNDKLDVSSGLIKIYIVAPHKCEVPLFLFTRKNTFCYYTIYIYYSLVMLNRFKLGCLYFN